MAHVLLTCSSMHALQIMRSLPDMDKLVLCNSRPDCATVGLKGISGQPDHMNNKYR